MPINPIRLFYVNRLSRSILLKGLLVEAARINLVMNMFI